MNKLAFKKKLIESCVEILQKNYEAAAFEMNDALQAANESGPPKDRYDPFRSQMLRRRNMFAEQCAKSLADIETIKKIDLEQLNDNVSFGAVVITSAHRLFFAISLGKIEIDGEMFFVSSIKTPLFEVIKNKTTGDEFIFNAQKFHITDVF